MPTLAADGRDPQRVPENWQELVDPTEWQLDSTGLPFRQAARLILMRHSEAGGTEILLVRGHDTGNPGRSWLFLPGGGCAPGESPEHTARRECREETGIGVDPALLCGPVIRRRSIFDFAQVHCRQHELVYLAIMPAQELPELDFSQWTDGERECLDEIRWWPLEELTAAVASGTTVYPRELPTLACRWAQGWDGHCALIDEE